MKTKIYKSIQKRELLIIAITLVVGLFLGSMFFGSAPKDSHEGHDHGAIETVDETTYTCSMHPQIKQPKPGDCPICGMDLIPLLSSDSGDEADPNEIQMTESAIKLAEIETYIVEKGAPEKQIYLQGKVQADERNISAITARFGGRIEKLYVNYTGQNVKKGQKLASIYSPDLNTAQRELLDAAKYKDSNPSFYKATRNKLKLWELNDEQINAIEEGNEPSIYFDILSPISGTVTRRDVAIGDYVKEGHPLFEVINLSQLWVMFDAYESDLPWIKMGDELSFTLPSIPGETYTSKVTFIEPFIDAKTRVAQVRINMKNSEMKLKPEMFANGILESNIAENTQQLLIPKTSILWTGKRAVVYVRVPDRESPSFIYREIELGAESGQYYVVSSGLEEGEEIASNGVFKIDASAQLLGKTSMMNPEGGKVSTGHEHHGATAPEKEEKVTVSHSEKTPEAFKKQLGALVHVYASMKDAFVATDEALVEKEAKLVLEELKSVNMKLLKGEAHNDWMKNQKVIKSNLESIISMKGIKMKRSHFGTVSDHMIEAVNTFGIKSEKTIYLEYCPMAFGDKGGYWLSREKEIRNPYFGDQMLKCGEVKKEYTNQ